MKKIDDKIRRARKDAGLTQIELSKKLGVKGNPIGKYEMGISTPKIEALKKIAKATNKSLAFFLEGDDFNVDVENNQGMITKHVNGGNITQNNNHQNIHKTTNANFEYDIEEIDKRLDTLLKMKEKGSISEKDYEEKKQELLNKI
ncbi:MAG: helix-turn-helix domain-containing protein [bacterium]|nr:helix-turn-helix domain-containing protein [bacterium]